MRCPRMSNDPESILKQTPLFKALTGEEIRGIALVFSVGLEYFFSDDKKRHVIGIVRRGERKRFPERPDGRDISFFFESLDFAAWSAS